MFDAIAHIDEASNLVTQARPVRPGTMTTLVQSDVSSATVAVYDLDSTTPSTAIYSTSLTVSAVMFTSLQVTNWGGVDSTGYTFTHTLANGSFSPAGGRRYHARYELTTSSYGVVPIDVLAVVGAAP